MNTQLVQSETGVHLAFPTPANGSGISGVLRTTDMRGSAAPTGAAPKAAGVGVSIMTLCKTIIGSGLLALPYALAQTGLVLGVVLLVLVGAIQAFVLHLLAVCVKNATDSQHLRADPPSFYSLSVSAGLPPAVVESCVGLATFGFATSYLVVMGDQASLILSDVIGQYEIHSSMVYTVYEIHQVQYQFHHSGSMLAEIGPTFYAGTAHSPFSLAAYMTTSHFAR